MFIGDMNSQPITFSRPPIAEMKMGDGRHAIIFSRGFEILDSPQTAFPEQIADAMSELEEKNWGEWPASIVIGTDPEETHGYLMQIETKLVK